MEYYRMRQRADLRYVPMLKNVYNTVDKRDITEERIQRTPEILFFELNAAKYALYPDIIDRDLFLVSARLMDALEIYEPELPYRLTVLSDMAHEHYVNYYMPIWEHVECLSGETKYNMDKSVITKLVLDEKRIGDRALFRVKHGITPIVVARLDTVESILRRDFIGVAFEQLLVETV